MDIVKAKDSNIKDILKLNSQIHVDTPLFQGSSKVWVVEQVKKGNYFVMQDDNEICGAICLLEKDGHFYLETIAVDERQHGKGIGTQFINFAKTKPPILFLQRESLQGSSPLRVVHDSPDSCRDYVTDSPDVSRVFH